MSAEAWRGFDCYAGPVGGNFKRRNKSKPPLVRLDRSHRRLEERLQELAASVEAISRDSSNTGEWSTVADVLAHLQRAVVRHEEDEEESVFPRLAVHPAMRPLLSRLRGDHESQRKLVSALDALVQDHSAAEAVPRLQRVSAALNTSYLDHIKREDRELLPAITRHISAEGQAEMAIEMAERRAED